MVRRTDRRRDTKPAPHELFNSQEEKDDLEARNVLLQFDEVLRLIDESIKSGSDFKLHPRIIQYLHGIAIQDIYTCAGNFRKDKIIITGTDHQSPPWSDVPKLVDHMCEYVNNNWSKSPIHLSAYVLWRINWIHPFMGGNGRTARAVSYLVLCARLGSRLPDLRSIPDLIVANRQSYYSALDATDSSWSKSALDVSAMEELLEKILATQLMDVIQKATDGKIPNQ